MKKENQKNDSDLRKKAEKQLKPETIDIKRLSEAEVRKLAHELQVHQIELDMQNEELRKSQQTLEDSKERYARLYDFAPVGYFTISEEGIILEANLKGAAMLGIERIDLIGNPLGLFITKEDQDIYYRYRNKVCKSKDMGSCELKMVRRNGALFYALLECEAVRDWGKNTTRYMTVMSDISERKEMEAALLESEKLKSLGTITAGISHEFNNILAIIMSNAELLERDFKGGKESKKRLEAVINASDDGREIVKRMLMFSAEEQSTSHYVLTDVRYLIKQVIDFAKPRWRDTARSEGINYHIDTEGIQETPEVFCNPVEWREVFTNLINNALDAMPDGGRISFSTESDENTVFVSVSDTGKGVSEDVKKKIFDPFFTTRKPRGTGLGMSVVYGIIKRHGGNIEVESTAGKGATCKVGIPIQKDAVRRIVSSEPVREVMARKLRVLVVDDNVDMCEAISRLLTGDGHTVQTSYNGAEAIELAGKGDFDLVLCDLVMSKVSGYDVVRMLNKLEKRPKIGIVTGGRKKSVRFDEEGMKVDFILKKPFKHSELRLRVRSSIVN